MGIINGVDFRLYLSSLYKRIVEGFAAEGSDPPEEPPFCTWETDDHEIRLIKKDDSSLETVTINRKTQQTFRSFIPLPGDRTAEEALDYLLKCDVTVSDNACHFVIPPLYKYWPVIRHDGQHAVNYSLHDTDQLMWRIFELKHRRVSYVPADPGTEKQIAEPSFNLTEGELLQRTRSFYTTLQHDSRTHRISSVTIDPSTTYSLFATDRKINYDTWGITLISGGTSSNTQENRFGHAQIIYEGIEDALPVVRVIHLTATAKGAFVKHKPVHLPILYRKKTQTWLRPRVSVHQMVAYLEREQNKTIPFNLTGNRLLRPMNLLNFTLGKISLGRIANDENIELNCLTCALRLLKLAGIFLPPTRMIAVPDSYIQDIAENPTSVRLSTEPFLGKVEDLPPINSSDFLKEDPDQLRDLTLTEQASCKSLQDRISDLRALEASKLNQELADEILKTLQQVQHIANRHPACASIIIPALKEPLAATRNKESQSIWKHVVALALEQPLAHRPSEKVHMEIWKTWESAARMIESSIHLDQKDLKTIEQVQKEEYLYQSEKKGYEYLSSGVFQAGSLLLRTLYVFLVVISWFSRPRSVDLRKYY